MTVAPPNTGARSELVVRQSAGHEDEHLALALGQDLQRLGDAHRGREASQVLLDESPRQARCQQRLAGSDRVDGDNEAVRLRALVQALEDQTELYVARRARHMLREG